MSQLLQAWNDIVRAKEDNTAIVSFPSGKRFTFGEVDRSAESDCSQLRETFQDPHSKVVGIKVENREQWLITFLALIKAEAIIVPIDGTSTPQETLRILHATGCNAWFSDQGFQFIHNRSHPPLSRANIQIFKITSGSTSIPKSIAFTESQMIADAQNILETMDIGENDLQFATIPLGHSYGLGSLVYPFLLRGIPIVFNSIPLPGIIEKELKESQATVMPTIPAILKALSRSESTQLSDSLRLVVSAASPLTADLVKQFYKRHRLKIHNFYGSSETGGIAYDTTGELLKDLGSVGVPMKNVEVSLSKTGRVQVRSGAVYTHKNRNKIDGKGCFLLSDFAEFQEGALLLKGRSNRIIKHNGKRLDLTQIEKTLLEHRQIKDAYVDYDTIRHRVVAAIVGNISETEFSVFSTQQLAVWKRPKLVWFASELPTNVRGKPDRRKIAQKITECGHHTNSHLINDTTNEVILGS